MAVSILGNVVTGPVGSRTLVTISDYVYTFSNGLTESNNEVKLGGSLSQNTAFDGAYSITIGGVVPITTFAVDSSTSINLTNNSGGNSQSVLFNGTNMTVTDTVNSKGLIYAGDYTSNFVARSLVDKGWVDGYLGALPLNIIPDGDGTRDLGSVGVKWNNLYSDALTLEAGATVDNIETVITDDNTHIATSSAIKTYVDTAVLAATNSGILVAKGVLNYDDVGDQTIVTLDGDDIVWEALVYVEEAFTGSGSNQLGIGYVGNNIYYLIPANILGSTGWKTISWTVDPAANSENPLSGSRTFVSNYTDTGADAGAGKAHIYIKYSQF
jgi:hypothetical protein